MNFLLNALFFLAVRYACGGGHDIKTVGSAFTISENKESSKTLIENKTLTEMKHTPSESSKTLLESKNLHPKTDMSASKTSDSFIPTPTSDSPYLE